MIADDFVTVMRSEASGQIIRQNKADWQACLDFIVVCGILGGFDSPRSAASGNSPLAPAVSGETAAMGAC